jgi:tetratricopeptide (TPR) repeat protein
MGKLGELLRRGVTAPVRLFIPKNPWLRIALILIPILLLAAFLEPVVKLLARGADLVLEMFTPLLDNPLGRLVLLNVAVIAGLVAGAYFLRGRLRALRSGMLLRNHLEAVAALVTDPARGRHLLRKVASSKARPPAEYPPAKEDAKIKLARLLASEGDFDGAIAWLTRVREKSLPRELRRSLLQLRVEAAVGQGEVLAESVEREIQEGLRRFPDDQKLLRLMRTVLVTRGALEDVVQVQEKIAAGAPPRRRDEERARLCEDLLAAGEAALLRQDLKQALRFARKANAIMPSARAGCLLGKVHLAEGDLKAAIKEWGVTRSPESLELMAEVLDRHPGVLSPRELLECSPTEGTLLLVAREYARQGEHERALRAARRVARSLGPLPAVTAVLGDVLRLCGQHEEAARIQDEALLRLLTGDAPRTAH